MNDKKKKILVAGASAGSIEMAQAVMSEKPSMFVHIVGNGKLATSHRYIHETEKYIISQIKEWQLIQQKQSKLSRNKRKQVVAKIDEWLKNGTITLKDLEI